MKANKRAGPPCFGGAPRGPAFRDALRMVTKRILIVPRFGCDEHAYRASD
jgi:hypothetical protein